MTRRTGLSKLMFALSFVLVAADIKFSMFGIPTVLLCLFFAYAISWELAHLLKVKWNAFTSESSSTSISLLLVGALFYFGCTDKSVAALIQTHGQNAAYSSIQWELNELTLIALSIGMMMCALVLAATIVSYAVDAWNQRKPSIILIGTGSSIGIGSIIGVLFGLASMMSMPKENALSLLSLIGGLGAASLIASSDDEAGNRSESEGWRENCGGKRVDKLARFIAGALLGALLGGGLAGVLTSSAMESVKAFMLVMIGAAARRPLAKLSISEAPETAPKILSIGIGFYTRHFLTIGICAPAALLLRGLFR